LLNISFINPCSGLDKSKLVDRTKNEAAVCIAMGLKETMT
jgi:hypothetical protein